MSVHPGMCEDENMSYGTCKVLRGPEKDVYRSLSVVPHDTMSLRLLLRPFDVGWKTSLTPFTLIRDNSLYSIGSMV